MSYSYKNGNFGQGWYTCGCGGKPRELAPIPPNNVTVRYPVPVAQYVMGASGTRYHIKPHMLMLDILQADADAWLAAGVAFVPTEQEKVGMSGYLARA